jgi:hypothetical protein
VLFLQSLLMLPATALSIKIFGVQRWQAALDHLTRRGKSAALRNSFSGDPSGSSLELKTRGAKQIARLVRAAANHGLYRANCLEQSLVLWCLLKRNGLESEIRFGARKEVDELQAHAWVECLGITLNEDRGVDQRYAPFTIVTASTPVESPLSEPVQSR